MSLTIRPLTPALASDYFDFFDHRAFTDDSPWYPCYCCEFSLTSAQIEEELRKRALLYGGGTEGLRLAMRAASQRLIEQGILRGYLAYEEDMAVGWCNANDRHNYARVGDSDTNLLASTDDPAPSLPRGTVKSVVCFEIAPAWRGQGIASALLNRVCEDARREGYLLVEGYPLPRESADPFDYTGPTRLYEKAGFTRAGRMGDHLIMQKRLRSDET